MVETHGIKKVCLQAQATDYGHAVETGYDMAVEELNLESVYVGKHKVTETDFVGTVTRLKNSGCELLFIGTITTDTIALYTAARSAGFEGPIMGNMVMLDPLVAAAADGGMEGLLSAGPLVVTDLEEDSEAGQWRRDWNARYTDLFGEAPNVQSQIAYVTTGLMIDAMRAAGPDLTTAKMLAELEKVKNYVDPFGGPALSFGPDKHQGSDSIYLSEVVDGKWQVVKRNLPY